MRLVLTDSVMNLMNYYRSLIVRKREFICVEDFKINLKKSVNKKAVRRYANML